MINTISNRPGRLKPNRPDAPARRPSSESNRVYDTHRFLLQGTLTDWSVVHDRYDFPQSAAAIARARGISTRMVQLRWLLNPRQLGYPTESFKVWRKPSRYLRGERIQPEVFLGPEYKFVNIRRYYIEVQLQLETPKAGGLVVAFAGAPFGSQVVDIQVLAKGVNQIQIKGSAIRSLVVAKEATLKSVFGVNADIIHSSDWTLVEQVGLPVSWNLFNLDQPQGLVDNPLDPEDAALDRYRRGAPFYGWPPFMAAGLTAPPWKLADPSAMIDAMADPLLDDLQEAVETYPPNEHHTFSKTHILQASSSDNNPATTQFSPFSHLIFGIASDPLLALIAGFGTAFDEASLEVLDPDGAVSDYMVTAYYENGLDGESEPIEYAAVLFAPALAIPPAAPANLKLSPALGQVNISNTHDVGHQAPSQRDLPWKALVRLDWDKISDDAKVRVTSYAAARAQQQPASSVVPLMLPRLGDSALQPISATTSAQRTHRSEPLSALDERYSIASTPAVNQLRYGVAHQDWFGLWSDWTTAGYSVSEPPPQPASLLSARLEVVPPASGTICPATLVLDIAWDWKVRSPRHIDIVGRLYPQSRRGDPSANPNSRPNQLPNALSNPGGAPLRLRFDGDDFGQVEAHPTLSGTVQYLSEDGKSFLAAPPETRGPRRYRLTVTGFSLDYANAGHIGLALWASGRENRAPQRQGPWTQEPLVVSASDPRAPVITGTQEHVNLASVADASGEHHALIEWPSFPGAVGYFVYTASETQIRADRGMGEAPLSQTLSQRLAALRDAFAADPNRQSFTRVNAQQTAARRMSVILPRGSKEIHLYMVIGVGAGQVESAWPDSTDPDLRLRPIAYAAPQIVPPAAPTLEVRQIRDDTTTPATYRAWLQVKTNPGATVSRIDIHRVRVPAAALSLDSMGPPIASLGASPEGLWDVTPTESDRPGKAQPIGTLTGTNTPTGSWKPVYYRAVAWAEDQPERGIYGSRSLPSAAREVLIPPTTPPHLSAQIDYEYEKNNQVVIRISSSAPLETPLGPHRIKVSVYGENYSYHYPPSPKGVVADDSLAAIPKRSQTSSLPAWYDPGEPADTRRYSFRLALPENMPLQATVELIDPLGRISDRTRTIPKRPVLFPR
ncbi:MAG: hypothetical protein ACFB0E_04365 [Leptolyngbyaceae cyanobacterium]